MVNQVQNKHNQHFKEWDTWHLILYVESFEELSLTSHQIHNLHLYHQAIATLYEKFPNEKRYQYRHLYFTEENPSGNYNDYLNWIKGDVSKCKI